MDRDELLEQSLEYFRKTFSGKGKLEINEKISGIIQLLQKRYDLEREEIFQAMLDYYIRKKTLEKKYQSEKALSTFVTHCCYNNLRDFKKFVERYYYRSGISLDAMIDGGFPEPAEITTPEDLFIGKELRELIFEHFGTTDALVLLGYEDLKKTATTLGMTYDAYRKRLWRKKEQFKAFLEKQGYCWN